MDNNLIQIIRKQIVPTRIFYAKSDSKASDIEKALAACLKKKHRPLFAPEVLDARIEAYAADPKNAATHPIFTNWYTTQSLRATGRDTDGKAWVVYADIPHYFSKPEHIVQARKAGLRNGAGKMPHKAFLSLLDRVDNSSVFAVPHETLKQSTSGIIPVKQALEHPQTIPFAGGRERAQSYLNVHAGVYGEKIGMWYCDDLGKDIDDAYGRLLSIGGGFGGGFGGGGRFAWVSVGAAGATQKFSPKGAHIMNLQPSP